MRRALGVAALLGALAVLPGAARAYPPITCGQIAVSGRSYVVHTHGPTCGFATRWTRRYMLHRKAPARFRCHKYGTDVPSYCKGATHKLRFRYFFANPAS